MSTERQIFGLPLGIYTNHFGKGCQRNNRGVYRCVYDDNNDNVDDNDDDDYDYDDYDYDFQGKGCQQNNRGVYRCLYDDDDDDDDLHKILWQGKPGGFNSVI